MKIYDNHARKEMGQSIRENRRESVQHGTAWFPCAGYLDLYRGDSYPWHWHDEMEVAYAASGSITVSVNGSACVLEEGEGIFINARVPHAYSAGEGEAALPNILFLPSLLYGAKDSVFWSKYMQKAESAGLSYIHFRPAVPWQHSALKAAEEAFRCLSEEAYGYEWRVRAALSELMLQICQNSVEQPRENGRNRTDIDRLRKMLAYIQAHYAEPIRLEQIAASAAVSRRECLRIFQRVAGVSPKQHVIGLRLRRAKQLLADTDLPLSEVCGLCGFQDQSYFTRVFREKNGVPPAKYRRT